VSSTKKIAGKRIAACHRSLVALKNEQKLFMPSITHKKPIKTTQTSDPIQIVTPESDTQSDSDTAFHRRFPTYTCWFLFLFALCLFLLSAGVSCGESLHQRRRRRLFAGLPPWETSFPASNCISGSHLRNTIWPTLPRTNRSYWSVCPVPLPPPGTQC
jgi:hypothetical protein